MCVLCVCMYAREWGGRGRASFFDAICLSVYLSPTVWLEIDASHPFDLYTGSGPLILAWELHPASLVLSRSSTSFCAAMARGCALDILLIARELSRRACLVARRRSFDCDYLGTAVCRTKRAVPWSYMAFLDNHTAHRNLTARRGDGITHLELVPWLYRNHRPPRCQGFLFGPGKSCPRQVK